MRARNLLLIGCLVLPGCATTGGRPALTPVHSQVGIASYYGPEFHGRTTAGGSRYDGDALTAAHRTLPFGTRVRVTHLATGRQVVVTITDRGPWRKRRILDVSHRAARELGMLREGTARVRMEVVSESDGSARPSRRSN